MSDTPITLRRRTDTNRRICVGCVSDIQPGTPFVEYDDGEYYPRYCAECVRWMAEQFPEKESE
jgi:hypothetical protein